MPERVIEIVGEKGRVHVVYGGFKIEVLNAKDFPWSDVFSLLLEFDQQVWIEKRHDKLFIRSKPKHV